MKETGQGLTVHFCLCCWAAPIASPWQAMSLISCNVLLGQHLLIDVVAMVLCIIVTTFFQCRHRTAALNVHGTKYHKEPCLAKPFLQLWYTLVSDYPHVSLSRAEFSSSAIKTHLQCVLMYPVLLLKAKLLPIVKIFFGNNKNSWDEDMQGQKVHLPNAEIKEMDLIKRKSLMEGKQQPSSTS